MPSYKMMRSYLDMVTSGKIVESESYYTDDVKVHVRGRNVASGDYEGLAGYNAALGRIMGKGDEVTVGAHDLLVSDDHAVTLTVWNVKKGDHPRRRRQGRRMAWMRATGDGAPFG